MKGNLEAFEVTRPEFLPKPPDSGGDSNGKSLRSAGFFIYPGLPDRHLILKERIMEPFIAQRRHRTVSRDKRNVITQRQ